MRVEDTLNPQTEKQSYKRKVHHKANDSPVNKIEQTVAHYYLGTATQNDKYVRKPQSLIFHMPGMQPVLFVDCSDKVSFVVADCVHRDTIPFTPPFPGLHSNDFFL